MNLYVLGIPLEGLPTSPTHFRWEGKRDEWQARVSKRFVPLEIGMPTKLAWNIRLIGPGVLLYAEGDAFDKAVANLREKLALMGVDLKWN